MIENDLDAFHETIGPINEEDKNEIIDSYMGSPFHSTNSWTPPSPTVEADIRLFVMNIGGSTGVGLAQARKKMLKDILKAYKSHIYFFCDSTWKYPENHFEGLISYKKFSSPNEKSSFIYVKNNCDFNEISTSEFQWCGFFERIGDTLNLVNDYKARVCAVKMKYGREKIALFCVHAPNKVSHRKDITREVIFNFLLLSDLLVKYCVEERDYDIAIAAGDWNLDLKELLGNIFSENVTLVSTYSERDLYRELDGIIYCSKNRSQYKVADAVTIPLFNPKLDLMSYFIENIDDYEEENTENYHTALDHDPIYSVLRIDRYDRNEVSPTYIDFEKESENLENDSLFEAVTIPVFNSEQE
eukprot:TRINITY_DN7382_c0_g1_i12.p1 TRINITY_DN7382_c0_g1~~TRINITY_DN7382_c0_g1_i12.p1  ORF type:complete len:357 (+),score=62.10 TRINITY_DN7382_c0_g1_i12:716-1786(+)